MTAPIASVLAIVGVTASGKSSLAMRLAAHDPRIELVSVDSMQVYRGMDIGTAKPTKEEQAQVPHHLIDVVDVSEDFTVSEFQRCAQAAIADVQARAKVPVLVGGTGLHLRSVVDNLEIPPQFPEVVATLAETATAVLHERLTALDKIAAVRIEPGNRRRVVRALEVTLGSGRPFSSYGPGLATYGQTPFVMFGPRWQRPGLDLRVEARYAKQMSAGFLDEVVGLAARTRPASRTASQALGYRQLLDHLAGRSSLPDALDAAITATKRFARRQERWFRRDPRIVWADVSDNPMEAWGSLVREYEACI